MENTETKVCSKCGLEKNLGSFRVNRKQCIQCEREYHKHYRNLNKNICNDRCKKYHAENRSKICIRKKKYRIDNRDEIIRKERQYYKDNRESLLEQDKKHYYENRENILKRKRNRYSINRENEIIRAKKYREENDEKIREYRNIPRVKISTNLRSRVGLLIKKKNMCKHNEVAEMLGCSVDECRRWLESKFLPGMTWDNHGKYGWHIDHIIPCASFDLTKPEEQLKCFHYTNLQPLWWEDNLSKSDKIQVLTSEGVFFV